MLALTFNNPADFDRIQENDRFDILGLESFSPGVPFTLVIHHDDGTNENIQVNHTYNQTAIDWFKAGSALNLISSKANN